MPITPGKQGVKEEMEKFKAGQLHSGSAAGPIVRDRRQAVAIALSESGMSRTKRRAGRAKGRSGGR